MTRIPKSRPVLPGLIVVGLIWLGLLPASRRSQAANPNPFVTIQCRVIALPREQALRFTAAHHLGFDTPAGLGELLTLVEDKGAESVASAVVTTRSAQHALSETGPTRLEVEPVLGPSKDLIDVNIGFAYLGKKLWTCVTLKNGEAKFLGTLESPEEGKNVTYLVVITAYAPM